MFATAAALTTALTLAVPAQAGEYGRGGRPDIINNGGQGGRGGAGGAGGTGGRGGDGGAANANNTGNTQHVETNVRSSFLGLPSTGFFAPASGCQDGWGISLGGFGSPGGGGLGFQRLKPAGVDMGAYTIDEYKNLPHEKREEVVGRLWGSDRATLNCLLHQQQQLESGLAAQKAMTEASGTANLKVEQVRARAAVEVARIEGMTRLALPGREHDCNRGMVVVPKDGHVDPQSRSLRSSEDVKEIRKNKGDTGHEKCGQDTQRLLNQLFDREASEAFINPPQPETGLAHDSGATELVHNHP